MSNIPAAKFLILEGGTQVQGRSCSIGGKYTKKTNDDLFSNKKVVVFGVPGAFTPTCSNQLPDFEEQYDQLKLLGIDEVYCVSVNDTYVMNAWAHSLSIKNVKLLPDGPGDFTKAIGQLADMSSWGFGLRSKRYAAIINNGVVEKMLSEPNDGYAESSPARVIKYLQTGE